MASKLVKMMHHSHGWRLQYVYRSFYIELPTERVQVKVPPVSHLAGMLLNMRVGIKNRNKLTRIELLGYCLQRRLFPPRCTEVAFPSYSCLDDFNAYCCLLSVLIPVTPMSAAKNPLFWGNGRWWLQWGHKAKGPAQLSRKHTHGLGGWGVR